MIAGLALCAMQAVLVAILLAERTQRRRAEQALQMSEAARRSSDRDVQTLAGRLIDSQESERHRIARELHDNLSQKLALLCIDVESLASGAVGRATFTEALCHLSERAGDIAGDVHRLAHDLHPPKLELLGLGPAVEGLCRDLSRGGRVQIAFSSEAVARHLPAGVALCLFRIAQEALQNVVKHSGATGAIVRLRTERSRLWLHIADTGRGFDPASCDGLGLGLLSMRERVHFAGGRIGIRSAAGRGTHIVVNIPIDQDACVTHIAPTAREGERAVRDANANNLQPTNLILTSLTRA